jgi:hypothetical protein
LSESECAGDGGGSVIHYIVAAAVVAVGLDTDVVHTQTLADAAAGLAGDTDAESLGPESDIRVALNSLDHVVRMKIQQNPA